MGIEDEVLGTLNLLQMDLGVLEGQTSRGLFSNSIFDPSVIGATAHRIQPTALETFEIVPRGLLNLFWWIDRVLSTGCFFRLVCFKQGKSTNQAIYVFNFFS